MKRGPMAVAICAVTLNVACAVDRTNSLATPSSVTRMQSSHYADVTAVSGHLRFGSHARQLWTNEAALRDNEASECITLINTAPLESELRSLNGSFVEIQGFPVEDVFSDEDETSDIVDFGACNRVGFYVRGVRPPPR